MEKRKLLLHVCCAPDEAWVVHSLADEYDLHCFFCNPNIQPADEYDKRLSEAAGVATRYRVAFSAATYAPQTWEDAVGGSLDTPEGGERCMRCFLLRLGATARVCAHMGWPSFTTVMSISPHKRISMLNEAGKIAADEASVTYEPFDFKKKNGFLNSVRLSEELGLYRQDYCGCRLSRGESEERKSRRS